MSIYSFKTPLAESDVRKLRIGDIVYLSGERIYIVAMSNIADRLIKRITEGEPPFNLQGAVIYQCPIGIQKIGKEYKVRWVGATSSIMMEDIAHALIRLGARAIMGKGGMGEKTLSALKDYGAVYLATVGACSSVLARHVLRVVNMYDATVSPPLCEIEVKDFGPLIVGMDSYGCSLYEEIWQRARISVEKLMGGSDG